MQTCYSNISQIVPKSILVVLSVAGQSLNKEAISRSVTLSIGNCKRWREAKSHGSEEGGDLFLMHISDHPDPMISQPAHRKEAKKI